VAKEQQATAAANAPCRFTSLVGYEWTAQTGTANLHRNVIFGTSTVPDVPVDYLRYPTALALWQALDAQCKTSGRMRRDHHPAQRELELRANVGHDRRSRRHRVHGAVQVLTEIFQHKGNSECLPGHALSDSRVRLRAGARQLPRIAVRCADRRAW